MQYDTKIVNSDNEIKMCGETIKNGGLVVFPTETVYGLGANALDADAVKNIFLAKGRPQDNPLIVHIHDISEVDKYVYDESGLGKKLFSIFSPGPLTIVMKKRDNIPYTVSAGLDTVGLRIPAHKFARDLIRESGVPIAAPSANISGRPSPTTALDVYEDMNGKVPYIIDGGACKVGIESTVLSIVDKPIILRPGAITEEMLAPYLEDVSTFSGKVTVAAAPGMKYRHYAPNCEMIITRSVEETSKLYDESVAKGGKPIIFALGKNIDSYQGKKYLNIGNDYNEVAHNAFAFMRHAEKYSDLILCEALEMQGIGASVMNRLNKAASKK